MSTLKTHNLQSPDAGSVNITMTPNAGMVVTGISTFTGAIDANGDLDVDGHTNLDNVSISGITTFSDRAYLAHDLTITGTAPRVIFTDTNNNSDYRINVDAGNFEVQDVTNSYATRFRIKSDGNVGINDTDPSYKLNVIGDNAAYNGIGMLKGIIGVQNDTTAFGSSPTAGISFQTKYRTGPDVPLDVAAIWGGKENSTNGDKDGYMGFATREEGGSGSQERMRITSSGLLQLNNDSAKIQLGASQDLSIYHDGSSNRIIAANADLILQSNNYNIRSENGSSTYLNITSSGNVDINGTPPWTVTGGNYRNLSISGSDGSSSGFLWLGNGAATTNADFDLGRINFNNGATITSRITGSTDTSANDDGRIEFHTKATGGSLSERLRITSDGVMAYGPFASFAYSNIAGFFHVHSGARVNTGGANQFAAPKGGFVDNARYELEASLISYSTSAQQTIQAVNGAQLKIGNTRSNWSYYNNLPNYLLGHAATDCINTSNYTLTLKATMTVFLQRSNSWNAVPLSGWELLESNTNIYPGSTDSRLYVKTLAAGSYSGWDSDSAMYFFVL